MTDYAKLQTFSQQSILYSLEMMNDDMPCVLKLSDRSCCCKISVSCFAAEVVVRVSHLCLTVLSDPKHGNPEIVDIFVSVEEIYPNFEGVCVLCVCLCL